MSKPDNKQQPRQPDILATNPKLQQVMQEATNMDSRFDPDGCYTGRPLTPGDMPVQDADDL
jgi:hypothetical protein